MHRANFNIHIAAYRVDSLHQSITCVCAGAMASTNSGSFDEAVSVGQGEIVGNAQVDVWSEVIPPFNMMPREVLQVGGRSGRQRRGVVLWGAGLKGGSCTVIL